MGQEEGFKPSGKRVFSEQTIQDMNVMLEQVVENGTAKQAKLPRHTSAGKTGTIHLIDSETGKYLEDSYASIFAGFAPAHSPEIVMAIVITDPRGGVYYGGQVAGPVFSKVMDGALRYRNISPDRIKKEAVDTKSAAQAQVLKPDLKDRSKASDSNVSTIAGGKS